MLVGLVVLEGWQVVCVGEVGRVDVTESCWGWSCWRGWQVGSVGELVMLAVVQASL